MSEERINELEIKVSFQEQLINNLDTVISQQQIQIGKLEETCKLLHDKIKNMPHSESINNSDQIPPHY